ncbi:MAG: DUF3800 domain-containing protein [Gemmatimonadales bacterium]
MPTLHIHLDEAGNWAFNPKGSPYFAITATWTFDPSPLAQALTELRYSLVRSGVNIEGFHAAPQRQDIRNEVVATMMRHGGWLWGAVVVEKRKVHPSLYEPAKFYPTFAGYLLKFILRSGIRDNITRALVYTDSLPLDTNAKKEGVLKAIHQTCAAELAGACRHHAYSHCHESNAWIQATDYCCWSIQRKWALNDLRTYSQLRPRLAAQELNVTDRGDGTLYY